MNEEEMRHRAQKMNEYPAAIVKIDTEMLFEKAPLAMFIVNRDRRLIRYNKAAAAMAGRVEKTALGLRGGEFFRCVTAFDHPSGCGFSKSCAACNVRKTVLNTFQTGQEHRSVEASIPVKNEKGSHQTWVLLSTSIVHFGEKKEEGVLICMKDITERKRAEEALRQKNDELVLKGQLAHLFLTSSNQDVFADVVDLLRNEFNCRYGYFGYIAQEGDLICPSMTTTIMDQCRIPAKSIVFPKDQWGGLWGKSLQERISIRQNHLLNVPQGHISLKNTLIAPIVIGNELLGQIALADKPTEFHHQDEKKLCSIADFIAPILKIYLEKENVKKQLLLKAEKLKERNIALKVLLENGDQEIRQQAEKLTRNFDRLVLPYLEKLKACKDREGRRTLLEIIESNVKNCLSIEKPFHDGFYREFTPMEVQVADLIRSGKTSKEIASILNISPRSVYFHRNNLRRKLNISKTGTNLKTVLTTRHNSQ